MSSLKVINVNGSWRIMVRVYAKQYIYIPCTPHTLLILIENIIFFESTLFTDYKFFKSIINNLPYLRFLINVHTGLPVESAQVKQSTAMSMYKNICKLHIY